MGQLKDAVPLYDVAGKHMSLREIESALTLNERAKAREFQYACSRVNHLMKSYGAGCRPKPKTVVLDGRVYQAFQVGESHVLMVRVDSAVSLSKTLVLLYFKEALARFRSRVRRLCQ